MFYVFLLSLTCFAQSNYAVSSGTIMDPQGHPFAGATVRLTALNTGAERRVSSNEQGMFQVPGLMPGDYSLEVQATHFATLNQSLRLEVGQELSLNLTLKVATVQNVVEVADQASVLHTSDAAVGEVVEPVSIKELPLNGRMLIDLVLTVPGAHESHGAQTGQMNPLYWRPGQRSAVSIGGNRPNANYYLLDGATNTDPTFNTLNLSPSPDAVQEFKVQTGSYSAEMGGAGGGQINIVTRSGSNRFHGTAYEFLRNGALDASTFNSMGNKHLVQNNFGAALGGPIGHNKTLFFVNYEGFRHAMAHAMIGAPTVVGAGTDCNNYVDVRNALHDNDQGTIRIDHMFERGDSLSARYSASSEHGFTPGEMVSGLGTLLPGFGSFHDNFSQQGSIAWNRVINPRVLNTASITISRLAMHRFSENSDNNDIVSELGIVGVGFGGKGAFGSPFFNVQGFSPMGDNYAATPMKAWDTVIEGRDVLSWQRGRHSLKFGGSYRDYTWPMWGFFQNRGYYQFTNGFTTQTATNDKTGSALASFLLGLPAVKQRQAGIPQMQLRQWYVDGFVQDSFRVTPTLVIQMGLRYEFMEPLLDISYTNSNLTFSSGAPSAFIGGQNGFPKGLKYSNPHNFAPRFGISKAFSDQGIVLHAAYGIFFTPVRSEERRVG